MPKLKRAGGFVDTQRHVWQTQLRGVAAHWSLFDYSCLMQNAYGISYDPEMRTLEATQAPSRPRQQVFEPIWEQLRQPAYEAPGAQGRARP